MIADDVTEAYLQRLQTEQQAAGVGAGLALARIGWVGLGQLGWAWLGRGGMGLAGPG